MRRLWIACTLVLACALSPVHAELPENRAAALAALANADPDRRAEGIAWFARHGAMKDADLLHARLRDPQPLVRAVAEQGLLLIWSRSGDRDTDRLLFRGMKALQAGRLAEAINVFTGIVRKRPQFAEGWNKRATAYFLAGEFEKSIADCHEVFKRNPKHFGALAGIAQNWLQLGRLEEARDGFRRALEVNPNLEGVAEQLEEIERSLRANRV